MPVLGWLLSRKLKHAAALYERVLEINPENWSAMWFIGKVHPRFRNKDEALLWFERSHQINPSQPDVAREASLCAMDIGRQDMAVVFAHRATQGTCRDDESIEKMLERVEAEENGTLYADGSNEGRSGQDGPTSTMRKGPTSSPDTNQAHLFIENHVTWDMSATAGDVLGGTVNLSLGLTGGAFMSAGA